MDFVAATRALGGSDLRIITNHILPNSIGTIIVEATLELGYAIIEESGLSFLGFGIQPPTPSWGNLLSNAQENFTKYPWLAIFPGLIVITSYSIHYTKLYEISCFGLGETFAQPLPHGAASGMVRPPIACSTMCERIPYQRNATA